MSRDALDERRLRRLIDLGPALVSELDTDVILERLLETAREITGARYAAVGVLNESRSELERFITQGIAASEREAIGDLPRGRGVLGLLIDDPHPLRLENVSEHPRSYGFPPGHPPMETFLGVPITIRGETWGNLYLTDKEGGTEFGAADEEAAVVIAAWAAIAIGNARLYERAEGRREELERAVRRQQAMTEIARAVGGETELERVLETISKRARALVDGSWVLIALRERGELVIAAVAGELSRDAVGTRADFGDTVAGRVLRTRRPARIGGTDVRLAFTRETLGVDAATELVVPLAYRGEVLGVLIAGDRLGEPGGFTELDEELLTAFATSAATAVATARVVAEDSLRHSVESAERERTRWARELHDETLQSLGGLRVALSAALQRGTPEAAHQAATEAVRQLSDEIQKLRALITELRPATLDELGLTAALSGLVHRSSTRDGLEIDEEITLRYELGELQDRLDPEIEVTVYRLVQEALTNVAKHAGSSGVVLSVVENEHWVDVELSDQGAGFDPDKSTDGFGLRGMRERVRLVGGELTIESSPGAGTTITARVPAGHHRGQAASS